MASPSPQIRPNTSPNLELRTGVWRAERSIVLPVPDNWEVATIWPDTPPPLTEEQMDRCLENPVGDAPLSELCRGKSRPLVIVDDLNRPTPAYKVLPLLLHRFEQAGIPAGQVRVLVSTGTHGLPDPASVALKIGERAAASCEVLVHDSKRDAVKVGRTASGFSVYANPAVVSSDFVVGIGGIYPNQTAGFGGGSKLLLGVLGFRTIRHLHFRNSSMGWGTPDSGTAHSIRRDLDEIARMLKLRISIAVHIDADRKIVRLACGSPHRIASSEIAFAVSTFSVPGPGDADVVISNAYPSDVSLTCTMQKGVTPLGRSAPGASRVVIASCPDGIGHHGLFPVSNHASMFRLKFIARRIANMSVRQLAKKIVRRPPRKHTVPASPVWLYRPGEDRAGFSVVPAGFRPVADWNVVLRGIAAEHPDKKTLRVVVYPCAPLQILNTTELRSSGG